jgi:hypothetical protein
LLQLRRRVWQSLSDSARQQFTWPHPATVRQEAAPASPQATTEFSSPPPDPSAPLETFSLLLLEPLEVDHLELRGSPQHRSQYHYLVGVGWETVAIYP